MCEAPGANPSRAKCRSKREDSMFKRVRLAQETLGNECVCVQRDIHIAE